LQVDKFMVTATFTRRERVVSDPGVPLASAQMKSARGFRHRAEVSTV
jgi:hypothetical protein